MRMKQSLGFLALSALAVCVSFYSGDAKPVSAQRGWWLSDYQEALKASEETGKPILLEFR
ncbi:MAG: hypothetical protein P1V97_24410 [Planctomycetota bacterium]|nr:hypothetical protein [Planctomycetota bacterium]